MPAMLFARTSYMRGPTQYVVRRVHESVKVASIILQPQQKYVTQITASSEGTHRSEILAEYARLVSEILSERIDQKPIADSSDEGFRILKKGAAAGLRGAFYKHFAVIGR